MGLLNWWRKRQRQSQRMIFRYHNGLSVIAADPLVIWRRIINNPGLQLDRCAAYINAGKEPESTEIVRSLCDIFGLRRYEPGTGLGLTDLELVDVLGDFVAYMDVVKKNISRGLTSPAHGESRPSFDFQEAPTEPTKPASDSPSTPNEVNPASVSA